MQPDSKLHNDHSDDDSYKNQTIRHLLLTWEQNGTISKYTFRFNDTRRGFWKSSSSQNGNIAFHVLIAIDDNINMLHFLPHFYQF